MDDGVEEERAMEEKPFILLSVILLSDLLALMLIAFPQLLVTDLLYLIDVKP